MLIPAKKEKKKRTGRRKKECGSRRGNGGTFIHPPLAGKTYQERNDGTACTALHRTQRTVHGTGHREKQATDNGKTPTCLPACLSACHTSSSSALSPALLQPLRTAAQEKTINLDYPLIDERTLPLPLSPPLPLLLLLLCRPIHPWPSPIRSPPLTAPARQSRRPVSLPVNLAAAASQRPVPVGCPPQGQWFSIDKPTISFTGRRLIALQPSRRCRSYAAVRTRRTPLPRYARAHSTRRHWPVGAASDTCSPRDLSAPGPRRVRT